MSNNFQFFGNFEWATAERDSTISAVLDEHASDADEKTRCERKAEKKKGATRQPRVELVCAAFGAGPRVGLPVWIDVSCTSNS